MRQISNISQTITFPAITTTQAASEVMLLKSSRFVAVHFLSSTLWRVVIFYDRSVESCVVWGLSSLFINTHPDNYFPAKSASLMPAHKFCSSDFF